MKSYLEFEREIKDLEEELEKLKDPFNKEGLSEVETEKSEPEVPETNKEDTSDTNESEKVNKTKS